MTSKEIYDVLDRTSYPVKKINFNCEINTKNREINIDGTWSEFSRALVRKLLSIFVDFFVLLVPFSFYK